MCNYNYKDKKYGDVCTIQDYFQNWDRSIDHLEKINFPKIERLKKLSVDLPLDETGNCIFHSRKITWKSKNLFDLRFLQVWGILKAINDQIISLEKGPVFQDIDFRECFFIGIPPDNYKYNLIAVENIIFDSDLDVQIIFTGSLFDDQIRFSNTHLKSINLDFRDCTFNKAVQINNSTINRISFDESRFQDGLFVTNSIIDGVFECCSVEIKGIFDIIDNDFYKDVFFTESTLEASGINLIDNLFLKRVDFSNLFFDGDVNIANCAFTEEVSFTNTIFQETFSFEANKIHGNLIFRSTTIENKLFLDVVHFSISEKSLEGTIIFEGVNFMNIIESHRAKLLELSRKNLVIIGKGCIKYRVQSEDKLLYLNSNNQPLAIEFAHAFANFFSNSRGLNLGVEIKERDENLIVFFYFSDDNISERDFRESLRENEEDFLGLLTIDPKKVQPTAGKHVISYITSFFSILSAFAKISFSAAAGEWNEKDTSNLLAAISFAKEPMFDIGNLHKLILEKYSMPQIVEYLEITKNVEMKIIKPTFNVKDGGKVNIIEKQIINKYKTKYPDDIFLELISNKKFSKKEQEKILKYFEAISATTKYDKQLNELLVKIKNILDDKLSDKELTELNTYLFQEGKKGNGYMLPKYDAFLSFAEEDGKVAEKLYRKLEKQGLKIWFSRVHLNGGNSIFGVINEAIRRSDHGIVLLSKNTFSDKTHFPIKELHALLNGTMYQGCLLYTSPSPRDLFTSRMPSSA